MKTFLAGLMLCSSVVSSSACSMLPLDASISEYQTILKAVQNFTLDGDGAINQIIHFKDEYILVIQYPDAVEIFTYKIEWKDLTDDGIDCPGPYAILDSRETLPGFGAE